MNIYSIMKLICLQYIYYLNLPILQLNSTILIKVDKNTSDLCSCS